MYSKVRMLREQKNVSEAALQLIFEVLQKEYPNDWLLPLEIYELSLQNNYSLSAHVEKYIETLKCNKSYKTLIENGLALLPQAAKI